jgi:hypothetical protein
MQALELVLTGAEKCLHLPKQLILNLLPAARRDRMDLTVCTTPYDEGIVQRVLGTREGEREGQSKHDDLELQPMGLRAVRCKTASTTAGARAPSARMRVSLNLYHSARLTTSSVSIRMSM